MSILGWALKLFNKSVACRPKCYTLKYDAWGASLSSPSETAAKWRSSHLGSLPLSEPSNTYSHSALKGEVLRKGCYVLHVRHGFFSYDAANIQRENAKVKKKGEKNVLHRSCFFGIGESKHSELTCLPTLVPPKDL